MADYEVVREIFNQCSGNQMRDVSISNESFEDVFQIEAFMDRYRTGKAIEETKTVLDDGSIVFELVTDGLKQRISFDLA